MSDPDDMKELKALADQLACPCYRCVSLVLDMDIE